MSDKEKKIDEVMGLDKVDLKEIKVDLPFEKKEDEFVKTQFAEDDKLKLHKTDDRIHVIHPCWFKVAGALTTGTSKDLSWIAPFPLNIEEIYAYVRTAPTGAALTIDINKNGTSVLAAVLSVAAGANTGSTKALRISGVPHLNINDRLDVDIDQIGSSVAGSNLSVFVRFKLV